MKVSIYYGSDRGVVYYYPLEKQVSVMHDNPMVRKRVREYLNNYQWVDFPVHIGDHEQSDSMAEIKILPIESEQNMDLALSQLSAYTGVYVDWSYEHEDGDLDEGEDETEEPQEKLYIKGV